MEANSKMVGLNASLSIITLNENCLSIVIRRKSYDKNRFSAVGI